MKAHMQQKKALPLTGEGPYHGHPIRLTIGMIVKNEEKTLDRCLRSLQPLMKAVESELIVTDTGSTDRTVEIAEKYTDHILHFEWCDDFSAARNTGLRAARGEWFLFLDGDEWFENTDDLIRFFTSGECDRYNSAAYIQRNYTDDFGKKFDDYHTLRLTRMYPGVHFSHIVHEDLGRLEPVKFLDDFVHHYGYVFHSAEEKSEKLERNRMMMERELKENPQDLKAYAQLARQYLAVNPEKTEEYCAAGLQAEREHPDRGWKNVLLIALATALYRSGKYDKLLCLLDKAAQEDSREEIFWLEFDYMAQNAAFQRKEYERAAGYGNDYLRVWELYRSGRLKEESLLYASYAFLHPSDREQVLRVLAQTDLNLNQTEQAEKVMDRLSLSEEHGAENYLKLAAQVCRSAGDWTKLPVFYQKACSAADSDRRGKIWRELEVVLPAETERRAEAVGAFAALPADGDPYVRLCRLRKAETENSRDSAKRELDWFFQWNGEWNPVFSDVLFFAMKEKVNIMPLILKIDSEDLKYYASAMQSRHSDLCGVIRDYSESYSYENIRGLYWSVCLREKVLLSGGNPFAGEEEELEFFEEYARQTAQYARSLYRPELLLSDRISVLPRAHRFGYYMGLALSARDKLDGEAYLSNLRRALECYPVMERQISLLLKRFEREEKQRRRKADEFRALAKQVKERIQSLIAQGDLSRAGQVTSQLAALLPDDDPDVVRFRRLTHTEPDMNELASRLPQ